MTEIPFYSDWTFWSAFAAVAALVLSLYPYLIMLFRKPRIEIEVQSKIAINHKVGNPIIWMFVSIRNAGGKKIKLKSLSINLRRGEFQWNLPSPTYFETTSSQSPVLFIPRELQPGDYWEHGSNFIREVERNMEQNYRKAESLLRAEINNKRAALPQNSSVIVSAESNLVDPFLKIFDERFIWLPGEYLMELNVTTIPSSASHIVKYRFTLFDSDTDELKNHIDGYKFGAGIYYHEPSHNALFIPIHQSGDI